MTLGHQLLTISDPKLAKTLNKAALLRISSSKSSSGGPPERSCKSKCRAMSTPSYWDDIIAYLKEDPTIRSWLEEDGESEAIRSIAQEDLTHWGEALQYKGFNVVTLLRKIKRSYDTYNELNTNTEVYTITYQKEGRDVKFTYTNKEKLSKDIHILMTIFITRGNSIDKIENKSLGNLSEIIDCLKEKLTLDTSQHDPCTSLGPEVVTLPRICACFPIIACDLQASPFAKALCTFENLGLPSTLNRCILCPFFPSCVPSKLVTVGSNNIHLLLFIVHIIIDNTIHRSRRNFTPLDRMLQYYRAGTDSPAVPQAARLKYCSARGLLNATNNGWAAAIVTALVSAENKIVELRPDDMNLQDVLSQLRQLK